MTARPEPRTFGPRALVLVAVLSATAAAVATRALSVPGPTHENEVWQCPMHPSVLQDRPGSCPICGMKLVKLDTPAPAATKNDEVYQCPMHPSVVRDQPGKCPLCGMKLLAVDRAHLGDAGRADSAPRGLAEIEIDPARQQLIGLKTATVTRGPVGNTWRTSGRVAIDETRVRHVNVKIAGFVERIFVDFIGRPVKRGDPLFSLYSPELVAAQDEYLLAVKTRDALAKASAPVQQDGDALVAAARRKLTLWDVPDSEIDRLTRSGQALKALTFRSPASGVVTKKDVVDGMKLEAGAMPYEIVDLSAVWVLADVYEAELRNVKEGLTATLKLSAFPNREFTGKVVFIDPLLDPKTRTVKVRLNFPNPTGELKPEMFGEVVLTAAPREALSIPPDAVIDSGTEKIVFVHLGSGKFRPRRVKLGDGDASHVEIVSGLDEGEQVVTRANFLIDSESRLRASLAELTTGGALARDAGADPHAGHAR